MARQNPVWQLWHKPQNCTERFRFAVGFLHLSTRGVVTLLGPCFKTGGSGPSTLAESPAWADRECRRPDKGTLKCTPTHQAATSHPAPAKRRGPQVGGRQPEDPSFRTTQQFYVLCGYPARTPLGRFSPIPPGIEK
jgi:hypothetical protein